MAEKTYVYVVVRRDLSPTHQLIQSVHAAHEAGIHFGKKDQTANMVVCTVPDEEALKDLAFKTTIEGIRIAVFEEDDFDDQATAIATEPITRDKGKFFRKLPLWTPEHAEAV